MCLHALGTDCCLLSRTILVSPSPDEKAEHGLFHDLAENFQTKYTVILAFFVGENLSLLLPEQCAPLGGLVWNVNSKLTS